jgi:CHAT domain-containing protein
LGFRHRIGLPLTIGAAPDAPTIIPVADKPGLAVNVYTDFLLLADHKKRLQQMNVSWELAESRQAALDLMKQTEAQAVYFYCHGGLVNGLPFLKLGHEGDDRLVANNLLNSRIRWRKVRPLIFINGCHTTALSPEAALDLVSAFVGISHAAGVVGTEITIFEETAVTFAEAFFKQFLQEKQTVGEAVRTARLEMLQARNPLGLVYVPYVLPGLKLAQSQ